MSKRSLRNEKEVLQKKETEPYHTQQASHEVSAAAHTGTRIKAVSHGESVAA